MSIAFQRDFAFERARASGHCSGDLDYINVADSSDMYNRDGRGSYFFHGAGRGGERQGKKSTGRGGAGNPPFPTMRGGAGKGSKSAGWGGAGAGNMLRVSAD